MLGKTRNAEVWRAMEDMLAAGKVRAIGISNFLPHHLEALLETARVIPAVNQIRLAPGVYQSEAIAASRKHGIFTRGLGTFWPRRIVPK